MAPWTSIVKQAWLARQSMVWELPTPSPLSFRKTRKHHAYWLQGIVPAWRQGTRHADVGDRVRFGVWVMRKHAPSSSSSDVWALGSKEMDVRSVREHVRTLSARIQPIETQGGFSALHGVGVARLRADVVAAVRLMCDRTVRPPAYALPVADWRVGMSVIIHMKRRPEWASDHQWVEWDDDVDKDMEAGNVRMLRCTSGWVGGEGTLHVATIRDARTMVDCTGQVYDRGREDFDVWPGRGHWERQHVWGDMWNHHEHRSLRTALGAPWVCIENENNRNTSIMHMDVLHGYAWCLAAWPQHKTWFARGTQASNAQTWMWRSVDAGTVPPSSVPGTHMSMPRWTYFMNERMNRGTAHKHWRDANGLEPWVDAADTKDARGKRRWYTFPDPAAPWLALWATANLKFDVGMDATMCPSPLSVMGPEGMGEFYKTKEEDVDDGIQIHAHVMCVDVHVARHDPTSCAQATDAFVDAVGTCQSVYHGVRAQLLWNAWKAPQQQWTSVCSDHDAQRGVALSCSIPALSEKAWSFPPLIESSMDVGKEIKAVIQKNVMRAWTAPSAETCTSATHVNVHMHAAMHNMWSLMVPWDTCLAQTQERDAVRWVTESMLRMNGAAIHQPCVWMVRSVRGPHTRRSTRLPSVTWIMDNVATCIRSSGNYNERLPALAYTPTTPRTIGSSCASSLLGALPAVTHVALKRQQLEPDPELTRVARMWRAGEHLPWFDGRFVPVRALDGRRQAHYHDHAQWWSARWARVWRVQAWGCGPFFKTTSSSVTWSPLLMDAACHAACMVWNPVSGGLGRVPSVDTSGHWGTYAVTAASVSGLMTWMGGIDGQHRWCARSATARSALLRSMHPRLLSWITWASRLMREWTVCTEPPKRTTRDDVDAAWCEAPGAVAVSWELDKRAASESIYPYDDTALREIALAWEQHVRAWLQIITVGGLSQVRSATAEQVLRCIPFDMRKKHAVVRRVRMQHIAKDVLRAAGTDVRAAQTMQETQRQVRYEHQSTMEFMELSDFVAMLASSAAGTTATSNEPQGGSHAGGGGGGLYSTATPFDAHATRRDDAMSVTSQGSVATLDGDVFC
jgi:hypothetical protein